MIETGKAPNGCLSDETIAALVDGRLDAASKAEAERHAAQCDECYRLLVEVGRMLPAAESRPVVVPIDQGRRVRPTRSYVIPALAAAAVLTLVVWTSRFLLDRGDRPELRKLVAAVGATRPAEARLTGGFAYAPFDSAVRSGTAAARRDPNVEAAAAELDATHLRTRSAVTLAAFGTSRLAVGETARAVEALEEATAIDGSRADFWSDLAGAYLARAGQAGSDADVSHALDLAETAIKIDPRLPEAHFNRALALERLGMIPQAREAWTTYLSIDTSSPWRDEARRRLEGLPQTPPKPSGSGDAEPLRQNLYAQLLTDWTSAVSSGGSSDAALTKIRAAVADIERIAPDVMARDLLRAIERAESAPPATRRAVAAAHAEFVRGQRAVSNDEFDAAAAAFRASRGVLSRSGSPLALNVDYNGGVVAFRRSDNVEARRLLEVVRPEIERHGYNSLLARTDWMLGLVSALQGRRREAAVRYESALQSFEKAADPTDQAALRALIATNYDNIGDPQRGWTYRVQALRGSPRPGVFLAASLSASQTGWLRAALVFAQAGLIAAREADSPANMADALRLQAAIRAKLGELDAVSDLVKEAKALIASRQEPAWDRVRAEIGLAEAQTASADGASAGITAATASIEYFTQKSAPSRLPELLAVRASLYRRSGDLAAAARDVRDGVSLLERQRAQLMTSADQVTFEAVERRLLAELVALAASDSAADEAFTTVDGTRGRDIGMAIPAVTAMKVDELRQSLPARLAFIEFVVNDEATYAWIVTRDRKVFQRIAAGRRELAELVRAATPPRNDPAAVQKLSALLVAPVEAQAPPPARLVIVPDGPLHALPFGLLRQASGRRVVSDYAVILTPSAGSWRRATAALSTLTGRPDAVTAVGAPALDRDEYGELPGLPYAAEEAVQVAASYPSARTTVLRGNEATRDGVMRAFGQADVVHFAGHAVANPLAPEASFLALAGPAPSRLTAADIRRLNLARSRLVVLAACDTAAGSRAVIESPLSLSRAFLAAGAAAVIGNLWPTGDRASRELFRVFHREFAATGDAAEALRRAQESLASSTDPSLAPPRLWAGFVLMGASGNGHDFHER